MGCGVALCRAARSLSSIWRAIMALSRWLQFVYASALVLTVLLFSRPSRSEAQLTRPFFPPPPPPTVLFNSLGGRVPIVTTTLGGIGGGGFQGIGGGGFQGGFQGI